MMMEKRQISRDEAATAPQLPVRIPDFPGSSHPFSRGRVPEIYTEGGLKKQSVYDTNRTDWFLKRLCTIWEIAGNPVPFYFTTADGILRSLDAGCVGFLVNTSEPRLKLKKGPDGFIVAVEPTEKGLELSRPKMRALRKEIEIRPE